MQRYYVLKHWLALLCDAMAGTIMQPGVCKAHNVWHVQVGFKRELIKEVRLFVLDAQEFRQDWEANGPMVPGLDPMDAVDRLKKFQLMFEVCTYKHYSIVCVHQSIPDQSRLVCNQTLRYCIVWHAVLPCMGLFRTSLST